MSRVVFWIGLADAAVGALLMLRPETIYHSAVARAVAKYSGLRLANPYPTNTDGISAQHAVHLLVVCCGLGAVRASKNRAALPPVILMRLVWAIGSLATVVFTPQKATSTTLMTGFNHIIFTSLMLWDSDIHLSTLLQF